MKLIDTHAHLYTKIFQNELDQIIENAQNNYVQKIYMPNLDEKTIEHMLEVALTYSICFPMIGIHPCHIAKNITPQLYIVEEWLKKNSFVAIGEIGIDLYHDTYLQREQEEAFNIQISLAKSHGLPLSIHCRSAFKEVIQILEKEQDGSLRGVIHCFTGNAMEAEKFINLGFYLGIGGIITMPKSGLEKTIAPIDLQHIVLETDSPYLTPTPHRGKRNEPGYLLYIAQKLAAVKGITLEKVAAITSANAEKVFKRTKIIDIHGNKT